MTSSDSQILLRLANTDDIPAIKTLINESVRALSSNYYTPEQIEAALTHVFGVDTQLILDQTYFVAEADSQLVGAGGWSRRNTLFGGDQMKLSETDSLIIAGKEPARLRAFYVHPRWARRGIGRLITKACEAAAVANGFSQLELISTLPGQPLYAANGYAIVCPFQIPLPDGTFLPAFRMRKELAD